LREDNGAMSQQINQLNFLISKLKSEIAEKDNMIGRSMNTNEQELIALKQQLDMKRQEVAQANKAASDLRIMLKEQ
jgi:uncharacterized protein (DUF3084 family)